jgi:hypothetical protein
VEEADGLRAVVAAALCAHALWPRGRLGFPAKPGR